MKLAAFGDRATREAAPSNLVKPQAKGHQLETFLSSKERQKDKHELKHVNFAAMDVEQDLVYKPRT